MALRCARESLRAALARRAAAAAPAPAPAAAAAAPPAAAAAPPAAAQLLSLRAFAAEAPRGGGAGRAGAARSAAAEQGRLLAALVAGMVGLTYASVPLYRLFCQATGYGGTVQEGAGVEAKLRARAAARDAGLEAAAAAREVTVHFNADVADGLAWRFAPAQRALRVRPGQSALAFYTAHNTSDVPVTGVSTYNVAPAAAGAHFNKVQCFCFEEQRLRAGERVEMPIFFYLDPEYATDPRLAGVNHLTLSYTFFKVSEGEEEGEGGKAAAGAAAAGAPAAAAAGHAALAAAAPAS
jgi:cytochrome c oxidase assembly protein subunit 11